MKYFLITIVCCFYILISSHSYGQTTFLSYKVKGKSTFITDVSFSNKLGNFEEVEPSEYFSYSSIYFLLSPNKSSAKNYFKDDDVSEILSEIILIQEKGVKVNQSVLPRFLLNEGGKIDRVIITFPKNKINEYDDISFKIGGFFSEKIKIGEKYFQTFAPQKRIYEFALSQIDQKDFLGAYANFMKVIENADENVEIQQFSFYLPLLTIHIPSSIELFIASEQAKFDAYNKTFLNEKTISSLNICDAFTKATIKDIKIFDSFRSLKTLEVIKVDNQINTFLNILTEQNQKNLDTFEQEKMLFFKEGDYKDYKFSLFVDMISKMLVYKKSLSLVDKVKPLDINLLDNFPNTKGEFIGDWEEDLKIYISLINKTIEQDGIVFKDDVMSNLQDLSPFQKQPYYEIISAFNSLNTNADIFNDYLKTALIKSSDEIILDFLENWLLSYRLTTESANSDIMAKLNEGINLIQKEQYIQADTIFNVLLRMASENAPVWYYSGRIKYSLDENYSAERFFKKALEIYPEFIAPHKFILNISENNKDFRQYLENTNNAVEKIDIWYFHYKRASAYYQLKMYREAIAEITQECMSRNPWDLNQYFLLGDAYLALNDFDNAIKAYEKTVDINPLSDLSIFDERMKLVDEKRKRY